MCAGPSENFGCGSACPVLLVVPHRSLAWWVLEIERWLVRDKFTHVVYAGEKTSRDVIRSREWTLRDCRAATVLEKAGTAVDVVPFFFYKFDILVTTPAVLHEDCSLLSTVSWSLIAAEASECNFEQLRATLQVLLGRRSVSMECHVRV